jgi:hypothetical protein
MEIKRTAIEVVKELPKRHTARGKDIERVRYGKLEEPLLENYI